MNRYNITHLDVAFLLNFNQKMKQYQQLAALPPEINTQGMLIQYTLQQLDSIHPILAKVLDEELQAGNSISAVANWSGGPVYFNLLLPFIRKHKAKNLDYLLVKHVPYSDAPPQMHYQQYTTPLEPSQFLTADLKKS
ncbi:hypothetical protein HHL16_15820 [Pseudoflavitalea sp. G-6-1-2]|uniref:hypothetical protein n=1 Tax=Pseudoflavitalea sp. G-6-1-2 TaxID=2728841 RepID=UPI00146BB361|nr:hypothetical protein [Pseudoflavitalea sp. G-6-1-2]NML22351.1 hypothetical protein [Pseudoflavitalea sp. G-6-1-2]